MSRPSSRPTPLRATWTRTRGGRDIGEPVAATDLEDDTLTYSLDTAGAASFDIGSTDGQLRTKADLDHEITATYFVTITATDTAGATGTITVTITVNNVDEAGTVTLSSLQPQVRFQLTATLDDLDDVRGSVTWSWARSQNGTSSWTPISGATSAAYTPVTADVGDFLQATASYDRWRRIGQERRRGLRQRGAGSAGGAEMRRPCSRPTPCRATWTRTPSPGVDIGEPVTATDPEDDTLTYSLDVRRRGVLRHQ